MKNNVLLSIIIPIFNTDKYLQKCIESIISQNLEQVEIILINDGSTDSSENICYKYKYPFISYIYQENQGLSATRNNGINRAVGKYVMFIDSDDYLVDGAISDIKEIILLKEPDVIFGQIGAFREKNVKRDFYEAELIDDINKLNVDEILLQLSCSDINISPSVRYIVNRQFLIKHNLFFPLIPYEDVEWSTKVLSQVESIFIYNRKFYKYRLRSGSLSSSQNFEMYYTYSIIVKRLYSFSKKLHNPNRKEFVHNKCRYLLYRIRNEMHRLDAKEEKELIEFFKDNIYLVEQLYR